MTAAQSRSAPAWMVWGALSIVYVVWGSTYLAIRIAVRTMPPLLTAGGRFLVAGSFLYLLLLARRGVRGVAVARTGLAAAATVGAALVGANALVMVAEQTVPSGLAALIVSSVPLWVVVLRRVAGESVPVRTLAGVVAGFGGVALLLRPGGGTGGDAVGLALIVAASLSWAWGSFVSRRLPLPPDALLSTALEMIAGGVLMVAAGLATGEASGLELASFSPASLLAFAYLIFVGSLVAFTSYVWLLATAPISKVATYAYVNPVIAGALGWLVLAEPVTPTTLAGAAVIIASVAFTVTVESPPDPGPAQTRPHPEVQAAGAECPAPAKAQ